MKTGRILKTEDSLGEIVFADNFLFRRNSLFAGCCRRKLVWSSSSDSCLALIAAIGEKFGRCWFPDFEDHFRSFWRKPRKCWKNDQTNILPLFPTFVDCYLNRQKMFIKEKSKLAGGMMSFTIINCKECLIHSLTWATIFNSFRTYVQL